VDSEPAQSAFGPEKWIIGLALFFLFGIGVLWIGSKALWYQVSIPAPNLEAAGRAVLVQFRQPTNGLIFVQEAPRSADPDTSTVALQIHQRRNPLSDRHQTHQRTPLGHDSVRQLGPDESAHGESKIAAVRSPQKQSKPETIAFSPNQITTHQPRQPNLFFSPLCPGARGSSLARTFRPQPVRQGTFVLLPIITINILCLRRSVQPL
jgi:hypothetical protein